MTVINLLYVHRKILCWRCIKVISYTYLTGVVKRCLQKWWKQATSAAVTKYKKPPSPPLCFGHTAANHPPTAHCGFTLIGDQKQTIIQAQTSPGKNCQGILHCKVSLNQVTYSNYSQSLKAAPLPSSVLLTHNSLLELFLGCLEKQALTASPLHFERPQWLKVIPLK